VKRQSVTSNMLLASSLRQTTQALHANSLLDEEETTIAKLIAFINPALLHRPLARSLRLKFWTALMLKREESGAMTRGIAADAPISATGNRATLSPMDSGRD